MTAIDRSIKRVEQMIEAVTFDEGCEVRDMLADLRHYCDAKGIDFDDENRIANDNHHDEVVDAASSIERFPS